MTVNHLRRLKEQRARSEADHRTFCFGGLSHSRRKGRSQKDEAHRVTLTCRPNSTRRPDSAGRASLSSWRNRRSCKSTTHKIAGVIAHASSRLRTEKSVQRGSSSLTGAGQAPSKHCASCVNGRERQWWREKLARSPPQFLCPQLIAVLYLFQEPNVVAGQPVRTSALL